MNKLHIFLYILLGVLLCSFASAVTIDDINANLVFHLEMDTNCTLDSSVYVNEPSATAGTVTHHAETFVTNIDGYCNFDAGNTRYTYPFLPQYNTSHLHQTWALWFAYETGATINIAIGTEVGGDYYQLLAPVREIDSNKAWASIATGGAPVTVLTTSSYTTGKHYLVMTKNVSHMTLYVDGAYSNSVETTVNGLATIDILCIGGRCEDNYGYKGNLSQFVFSNVTWSPSDVVFMYNSGDGRSLESIPDDGAPTVTLLTPTNNTYYNSLIQNFSYNVSCDDCIVNSCSLLLNDTLILTNNTITNATVNYFNGITLVEGENEWIVNCTDNNSNTSFADTNFTLTIDTNNPIITPEPDLGNNNTIVWNTSLDTYINFSDNNEIYSINITWGNGTIYYNGSNLGVTSQQVNITNIINQIGLVNISARVCDAHTLTSIKEIDWNEKDNGLEFVMKKKFLFIKDEWVKIYPKSYSEYATPITYKQKDRYPFIFNKKTKPSITETFIVESSNYIDIIENKKYVGHLIIPTIGDNGYWIDFENDESTKTEVKRISDTKIEVTVYGLKSQSMQFNSIGELNCVTETFYFNNINPTTGYDTNIIVGDTTTATLNITKSNIIIDVLNATLIYNNTEYYDGAINNFSKSVIAPTSVDGNSSLIFLYWRINIDGTEYNLTSYNQNVSDFYLDGCESYTIQSKNYTVRDEDDSSLIDVDLSGLFNYSYNGIYKTYTLSDIAVNTTQICIFPNNITLTGNYYIYYESTAYPQRRYYDNVASFNNVSENIVLYGLASANGIYGKFQVVDSSYNAIADVEGTMKKSIGGSLVTVEQESTDDAGLATFWVNPDDDYTFTFSKAGIGSTTFSLRVTTTEIYVVTLGGTSTERNISYASGISYSFSPTTDLQNGTDYNFVFDMDSDYWTITGCTFYLKSNGTTIQSGSSYTGTTCDVTLNQNTQNYTTITAETIYNLNNSYDITVSTQYTVAYRYEGDNSLKNFLDDLKAFGSAGFNDFTRMVIAFIIILIIITGLSFKMGVVEPEMLIGLLIILTWSFSYIGWLTIPYESIRTEWLKQYFLAILVTLGGGSFILKKVID